MTSVAGETSPSIAAGVETNPSCDPRRPAAQRQVIGTQRLILQTPVARRGVHARDKRGA